MFRLEYFCPRIGPGWRSVTGFLGWPKSFDTQAEAQAECNALLWNYHSVRVLDRSGRVVYFV